MVKTAFQGFNIKFNLRETEIDRDYLNNLGGAPIADDIGLFANNLRNTSKIDVEASNVSGDTITLPLETPFVYTNNTQITVDGTDYTVADVSRNENDEITFRLKDISDTIVSNPPVGEYTRNDGISFNDINNLVKTRELVVEDPTLSFIFFNIGTENENFERNPYDSIIGAFDRLFSGYPSTIKEYFKSIEGNESFYYSKKNNSLVKSRDFETEYASNVEGVSIVLDEDDTNNSGISETNPGIFILNPQTDEFKRIFSSNENVWEDTGTNLEAETREIAVQSLVFEDTIKLVDTGSGNLVLTESGNTQTDFTHLTKVLINGEEYYLCLKLG